MNPNSVVENLDIFKNAPPCLNPCFKCIAIYQLNFKGMKKNSPLQHCRNNYPFCSSNIPYRAVLKAFDKQCWRIDNPDQSASEALGLACDCQLTSLKLL